MVGWSIEELSYDVRSKLGSTVLKDSDTHSNNRTHLSENKVVAVEWHKSLLDLMTTNLCCPD